MNPNKIAEQMVRNVLAAKGGGAAYKKFFDKKLKKYKVKSPAELSDAKKKQFFNEIEKEWTGDDDKKASARTAQGPYATLNVSRKFIGFDILPADSSDRVSGTEPYGKNAPRAIRYVLDLVAKHGIPEHLVEIFTT